MVALVLREKSEVREKVNYVANPTHLWILGGSDVAVSNTVGCNKNNNNSRTINNNNNSRTKNNNKNINSMTIGNNNNTRTITTTVRTISNNSGAINNNNRTLNKTHSRLRHLPLAFWWAQPSSVLEC